MWKIFATLFIVAGFIALGLVWAVWSGYVLAMLWGWFVIPVFKAPTLTLPVATGLIVLISHLTSRSISHGIMEPQEPQEFLESYEIQTLYEKCKQPFFLPLIALVLGRIIVFFV
jgi:hypothetical protein